MLVAYDVERGNDAFVKARAFFQHGLGGFQSGVFKSGQLGDLPDVGQVFDVEKPVFNRRGC